jgi:hypothetical protein
VQGFLDHFRSEEEDKDGIPIGLIPKMRYELGQGMIENEETGELELAVKRMPIPPIIDQYDTLKACVEDQIGKTCRFVLNPLNTTFKLLGDEDETALPGFVNPEQEDLATLMSHDIVDEIEIGEEMVGFPSITGAMEYASGIGDLVVAEVESKVLIRIIPRDCYDEPMHATLNLSDEIKIDFLKDETGSAELVPPTDGGESNVEKEDTEYTLAITADNPGKVVIKATICSVVIQAVTEAGIIDTREDADVLSGVDCIEDVASESESGGAGLAPGALTKVDRTLTILFEPKSGTGAAGRYGDDDRDESGKSAKPKPQTFGTKLEN